MNEWANFLDYDKIKERLKFLLVITGSWLANSADVVDELRETEGTFNFEEDIIKYLNYIINFYNDQLKDRNLGKIQ